MNQKYFAAAFAGVVLGMFFITEPQLAQRPAKQTSLVTEESMGAAPTSNTSEGPKADAVNPVGASKILEFKILTEKTLLLLPTLRELRELPESEVHLTPLRIREAGHALGVIAEFMDENPEVRRVAAEFYQECFQKADFPSSVRALCLKNHRTLRTELSEIQIGSQQEEQVQEDVKRLASFLARH